MALLTCPHGHLQPADPWTPLAALAALRYIPRMPFPGFRGGDYTFENLTPEGGPLIDQLGALQRRAAAAGRVACVYLRATWCPANGKLERTLGDPQMAAALAEVEAATLDIDVWGDQLTAAGYRVTSVPAFIVIDADGKPQGAGITGAAWGDDTAENIAPPLGRFFDVARAVRPAPPTPPPAPGGVNLGAIVLLVLAFGLLAGGVWWRVSYADTQRKETDDAERQRQIRESVQRSVQEAMKKPAE